MNRRTLLAIGTYTRTLPHVQGHASGVHFIVHDTESGTFSARQTIDFGDGPSYLAPIPPLGAKKDRRYTIVACNEGDGDQLPATLTWRSVTISQDFSPQNVSEPSVVDIGSICPCHISLSPSARWTSVATYMGGAVLSLPIAHDENGSVVSVGPIASLQQHKEFSNVDPSRQESPHAHQALFSPDGRIVAVCDLGADTLVLYHFDETSGSLHQPTLVRLEPGSGPRHCVFHPSEPVVFVLCELSSTVCIVTLEKEGGGAVTPKYTASYSTLPAGTPAGTSWCSAVRISGDGRWIFASNRGHDSVAVFEYHRHETTHQPVATLRHFATGFGTFPRDICLHPSKPILYVAAQNSDRLSAFRYNQEDGSIAMFGEGIDCASPVCIAPLCFHEE